MLLIIIIDDYIRYFKPKPSIFILFYVLLIYQLVLLSTYLGGNEISFDIANINILIKTASLSDIIVAGIMFSFITIPYFIIFNNIKKT
ncbi:hypothetical protein C5S36_03055 [Candidatus Methanophagaceae archaeon]|nr:hypothetical protein C5S36_03025 [Methanophagales archaeon]KAF5435490.1 hypothetical protein C5S36_03055 [Methanophagales archaeon]